MIEEVNLADVCDIIAGQSPPSSTYNQEGNGVPFFQGKADFGETYPTVRYWCNSPKKMSKPDDILFSVRAPVGPTNINNINACIGRGLAAIRCSNIQRNYLLHYLRGNEDKIASLGTGSTFKAITIGTLKELKIPLPPLDQQKKIAAILDAADTYRQKTKALIKKYDELTQSLFVDMFGDPVTNPKGWDEVIFTDVLILRRGFDLPVQDRTKGEYPIMASNGILDWHNDFKVQGPGVVTGRSGTLGHVHLVEADYWPLNTALYSQDLNGNNPTFLLFLVRNFRVERFSRGAGVPTLNRNLVHAESIMKIPIDLQNQFAERVQAIEAQKAQAQASLAQAEDLFNSLLQRAFKGELVN
jgi:type I restriction enzyme S subunit